MATEINSKTKIPLGNIGFIVAIALYVNTIKTDLAELKLVVAGRIDLVEYRVTKLETGDKTDVFNKPVPGAMIVPASPVSPNNPNKKNDGQD